MNNLPVKNVFLKNFHFCANWEQKYLYLIELGNLLPVEPDGLCISKYLVSDCQSKSWIFLDANNEIINLFGGSDSAVVKGLIAIIFIFYTGCSLSEIVNSDISSFLNNLSLNTNLTAFRFYGLQSLIKSLKIQAVNLIKDLNV